MSNRDEMPVSSRKVIISVPHTDRTDLIEIEAAEEDEDRIRRLSLTGPAAMASRQMDRGYFQVTIYDDHSGGTDLVIMMDGRAMFAIDRSIMRALGFRWRRKWRARK